MPRKKKPAKKKSGFVLDGSVALAWCFLDEASDYADSVARSLPTCIAMVPVLWHLEVSNALLVGERRRRCDQADVARWTTFLDSLSITVDEHNGKRVFRDVLSLARNLPLATLDEPLKAAANSAGVLLFTPSIP